MLKHSDQAEQELYESSLSTQAWKMRCLAPSDSASTPNLDVAVSAETTRSVERTAAKDPLHSHRRESMA